MNVSKLGGWDVSKVEIDAALLVLYHREAHLEQAQLTLAAIHYLRKLLSQKETQPIIKLLSQCMSICFCAVQCTRVYGHPFKSVLKTCLFIAWFFKL